MRPKVLYRDLCGSSTFDPISANEVFKDQIAVQNRLKYLVNTTNISSCDIQSQHFGWYLLEKINFGLQFMNEDLDIQSFNSY